MAVSKGRQIASVLLLSALGIALGVALFIGALYALFALFAYRSDKITGESDRAARLGHRFTPV